MLWTTITLLSFAFIVSTYIRTVATVYLLSLHGPRYDLDPLTTTAYQVLATRAGIDSALVWCTQTFSITTQLMVPGAGVEPARPFYGKRRILSPQCLPISPSGQIFSNCFKEQVNYLTYDTIVVCCYFSVNVFSFLD